MKRMVRGAITKKSSRLVTVWIPLDDVPAIDRAAVAEDSDRSKFIRKAIREKISRVFANEEARR